MFATLTVEGEVLNSFDPTNFEADPNAGEDEAAAAGLDELIGVLGFPPLRIFLLSRRFILKRLGVVFDVGSRPFFEQ